VSGRRSNLHEWNKIRSRPRQKSVEGVRPKLLASTRPNLLCWDFGPRRQQHRETFCWHVKILV